MTKNRGKATVCRKDETTCANDLDVGHGTHCAGTVGGKTYGVAKKSILHAVRVLGGRGGKMTDLISAMDWVLQNVEKPAVMSMSLGSRVQSQVMKAAVDKVVGSGITVVVAAGNFNRDACQGSPAFVRSAITVGATDKYDR